MVLLVVLSVSIISFCRFVSIVLSLKMDMNWIFLLFSGFFVNFLFFVLVVEEVYVVKKKISFSFCGSTT